GLVAGGFPELACPAPAGPRGVGVSRDPGEAGLPGAAERGIGFAGVVSGEPAPAGEGIGADRRGVMSLGPAIPDSAGATRGDSPALDLEGACAGPVVSERPPEPTTGGGGGAGIGAARVDADPGC